MSSVGKCSCRRPDGEIGETQMPTNTDKTSELLQAVLAANDERKNQALRVLRGDFSDISGQKSEARGPLLLGMSAGAKFLGVSRATLWRAVRAGKLEKVELFPGSMRVRREDLERLARGNADKEGAEVVMRAQRGDRGQRPRLQGCGGRGGDGGRDGASFAGASGREGDERGEA